jgi:aminopeptidase
MAQQAQMSTEAFEEFFYDVCTMDYSKDAARLRTVASVDGTTDRVLIQGPRHDLEFSIKGHRRDSVFRHAQHSRRECFHGSVRDSVNGDITFNAPTIEHGVTHENVRLVLKDGKVVEAHFEQHPKLNEVLDSDEGARYIASFRSRSTVHYAADERHFVRRENRGQFSLHARQAYEEADNGNRSEVHWTW